MGTTPFFDRFHRMFMSLKQRILLKPGHAWTLHWNTVIDRLVTFWSTQRARAFLDQHADLERKLDW